MLKKILLVAIVIVAIFLYYLYSIQDKYVYQGILEKGDDILLDYGFEKVGSSYYRGGTSGIIWVIFGGNRNVPNHWVDTFNNISKEHSIFLVIYPGYNYDKETKTTYENIYYRVTESINFIRNKGYQNKNINFLSYSLGCAISLDWLSKTKFKINNLVLLAPFLTLSEVIYDKSKVPVFITNALLKYSWKNETIRDIDSNIKVTIYHGKRDELIDYCQSIRLHTLRPETDLILTDLDDHRSIKRLSHKIINDITMKLMNENSKAKVNKKKVGRSKVTKGKVKVKVNKVHKKFKYDS